MKKNSGKAPSYQMYARDWNEDTALKLCSYAAEGLWIRLCNTSYEMPIKGVFVRQLNGSFVSLTSEEILNILRGKMREKRRLFDELTSANIIKKFEDGEYVGAFYCKRIYRDMKLREIRRESGKCGGNPNLLNQTPNQKPTPSSSSSSSFSNKVSIDNIYNRDSLNNRSTIKPTLAEVYDAASIIGISKERAKAWYDHYMPQGFYFANNLPITDLKGALVRWRNNQYKFERKKNGPKPKAERNFIEQQSEYGETVNVD